MIAEPVDAGAERSGTVLAIGEVEQLACVAGEQVEAIVERRVALDPLDMGAHVDPGCEIVADQVSAGAWSGGLPLPLTVVGHGREPSTPIDAQPGSPGLEISSAQNPGSVSPEGRHCARAVIELIPVGRNDEGIVGVRIERDQDEAHRTMPVEVHRCLAAVRAQPATYQRTPS